MRIVHTAAVIIAVLTLAAAFIWCTITLATRGDPAAAAITNYPRRLHRKPGPNQGHRVLQNDLVGITAPYLEHPDDTTGTYRYPEEEEELDIMDLEDLETGLNGLESRGVRKIRSVQGFHGRHMSFSRRSQPETLRDMQKYLRESQEPVDCCPSEEQLIEPEGAKDLDGMYVKLYRDGNITQRFFENSCREEVLNRPCRFVHTKLSAQSRCVQKYIYVYAIVQNHKTTRMTRDLGARHRSNISVARSGLGLDEYKKHQFHSLPGPSDGSGWRLDYISVRSGCSCEVKAKQKRNQMAHQSRMQRRSFD